MLLDYSYTKKKKTEDDLSEGNEGILLADMAFYHFIKDYEHSGGSLTVL